MSPKLKRMREERNTSPELKRRRTKGKTKLWFVDTVL